MKRAHRPVIATGALLGLWLQSPVSAQEQPDSLSEPATIELPELSVADNPKAIEEGFKFFYFHNPSVSFEDAYRDIADCRAHLRTASLTGLPSFVPWTEPVASVERRELNLYASPYGLVGAAIASIILPKLERGVRNNKLRMCMEPRGYARYPVPEASWETLNEGDEEQLILMQAKIASGPVPDAATVTEVTE